MHQCSDVYRWPASALDRIRPLLPETNTSRTSARALGEKSPPLDAAADPSDVAISSSDAATSSKQPRRWSWRWLRAALTSRFHKLGREGGAAADRDAYNHNLGFMVRQPGWVEGADPRSEAAWRRVLAGRKGLGEGTKSEL